MSQSNITKGLVMGIAMGVIGTLFGKFYPDAEVA